MRPSLLAFLTLLTIASRAGADSVDDFVKAEMARQHIPGCSIAVLVRDRVVKIRGYGMANLELDSPANRDTVYAIGSLTKQFTAMGILMLAESGRLSLDDKIKQYLLAVPDSWSELTIRNLLNQTSGIKNYTSTREFSEKMTLDIARDAIFNLIASSPLEFIPGTKYEYSNSNYFLLGMILEKASGQDYGVFLAESIFKPLGMKATGPKAWTSLAPNRAIGYLWTDDGWENPPEEATGWLFAAGSLMSSIDDFAKWARALYDHKLLKPETFDIMYSVPRLADGSTSPYACGWTVDDFRRHRRIWHVGGIPGFSSTIVQWPGDDLTVIAFANANCQADDIAMGISGLYIPVVRPLNMLSPKHDTDPSLTAKVQDLIAHFATGDSNVEGISEPVKKLLDSNTQEIFKELSAHMAKVEFLDKDDATPALPERVYYRIERSDGVQFLTVSVDRDGTIIGIIASPVWA